MFRKILNRGILGQCNEDGCLTRSNLRRIFETYGEFGMSDDLFDQMIQVAGGPSGSMIHGLVSDLQQFDMTWKNHHTTTYEDVMEVRGAEETKKEEFKQCDLESVALEEDSHQLNHLERKVTLAFIDYKAETYRRPFFVMLLWGIFVITYIAYVWNVSFNCKMRKECMPALV